MKSLRLFVILWGIACAKDTTDTGSTDSGTSDSASPSVTPSIYAFDSAFDQTNSVAYSGQAFRQLLMVEMNSYLGELTDRLNRVSNPYVPQAGEVAAALNFYFGFDGATGSDVLLAWSGDADALQSTFGEVSTGKNLVEKIAGNDPTGQHKDWSTDFEGWKENHISTPESLVRHWFDLIDAQAVAWAQGNIPVGMNGHAVSAVYITPEGQNLQQLLYQFLNVSVSFSQATDDYLDDDVEEKGLNSPHAVATEGESYTELEHAWDEAFGYFGAAQTYGQMQDDENKSAARGVDADSDGFIDLLLEVNWGHSVNAANRDLDASTKVPTDFTMEAWEGFVLGRLLLSETAGLGLSNTQLETLTSYRNQTISAWEKTIAATVVHHLNDCIQDLNPEIEVNTSDLIKHWSELKGLALGFQFNPRSPLPEVDFQNLHQLLGTAPVLNADYRADLLQARDIVGSAFEFAAENLGDSEGENGW
jgi:hypothetical protein